jgi:hypothetical protein
MGQILRDLAHMLGGPGHLRFLVQPAVAILFGIRDGRRDSHGGRLPFGVDLRQQRGRNRATLLGRSLRRILLPLCMAIALSMLFQYVVLRWIRLWPALLFATVLVALPYLVARGLSNRFDRRWHRHHPRVKEA